MDENYPDPIFHKIFPVFLTGTYLLLIINSINDYQLLPVKNRAGENTDPGMPGPASSLSDGFSGNHEITVKEQGGIQ